MTLIPKRLKKEPLVEVIWQLQFESSSAGEILPGLLFTKLKTEQTELTIERLPTADLPALIGNLDPNLSLAAKVRIKDLKSPLIWQVGNKVVTINCTKPYVGWDAFYKNIIAVVDIIEESRLIQNPIAHSLRYINLLTSNEEQNLSAIRLHLHIGDHSITQFPLQMRVEIPNMNFKQVVQILSPTEIRLEEGIKKGTVVDLETISQKKFITWEELRKDLEEIHHASKEFFFQHLLTQKTIEKLEPEY